MRDVDEMTVAEAVAAFRYKRKYEDEEAKKHGG